MNRFEEYNLIVRFMGYPADEHAVIVHNGKAYGYDQLLFDLSWEWLMPVVEKIEETEVVAQSHKVIISGTKCKIIENDKVKSLICTNKADTKLRATYKSVVDFIRWYHESRNIN